MYTNVPTTLRGRSSTNIKLQVSKIRQLPIFRQGVWNSDISEYVYSSNNVSIKLNQNAMDQLSKVYDGTPMRVIFTERVNICQKCCQGCASICSACCMGCVYCMDCLFPCLHIGYCLCGIFLCTHIKQNALNYFRDDYVIAHEIWFGYKNMPTTNAACCCCCNNDCGFDNIVTNTNKDVYVRLCCHTESISHQDASVVLPMSNTSVDYTGVVSNVGAYGGRGSTASRTMSQRGNLEYLLELERESLTSNNVDNYAASPSDDGVVPYTPNNATFINNSNYIHINSNYVNINSVNCSVTDEEYVGSLPNNEEGELVAPLIK